MNIDAINRSGKSAVLTSFPDNASIRSLLRGTWTAAETQGGRVVRPSKRYPGAWSVTGLLIRSASNVLIVGQEYEDDELARYGLRFLSAAEEWCRSHLQTARPPYAPINLWPAEVLMPARFSESAPASATLGYGRLMPTKGFSGQMAGQPLLWCRLTSDSGSLLIYADEEVPLNVGLVVGDGPTKQVLDSLKADSVVNV